MSVNRKAFDEAVVAMTVSSSPYFKDYVFYMHLLSRCKVVFDENLQAAAGVGFKNDHYILYLNPKEVIFEGPDADGNNVIVHGFCEKMPIQQRIGILKHEMLHIALGHLIRVQDGDKDFMKYNKASDTALDQEIERSHLPDYALYPDNMPTDNKNLLWGETAEYYYDNLKDDDDDDENKSGGCSEDGDDEGQGSFGVESSGKGKGAGVGDHSMWEEIEGDSTLQQEITKKLVEDAGTQTQKSKGNLPSSYSDMIEGLTINREVDWKRVLRAVVGNKKANTRKTLMRRDRRLPNANWIKGRTKDRIFELAVVSDVSGSVCDKALTELWGAILDICETYKTPVSMVQVDTQACKPEKLTRQSKTIERKACGGTVLAPAIQEFHDAKVPFDAMVVTTDGYLWEDDIVPFRDLNKPVIWLVESGGQIMDEMNAGKMRAIKLTNEDK